MLPREQESYVLKTQHAALARNLLNINLCKSACYWQEITVLLWRVHTSIVLKFSGKDSSYNLLKYLQSPRPLPVVLQSMLVFTRQ